MNVSIGLCINGVTNPDTNPTDIKLKPIPVCLSMLNGFNLNHVPYINL